MQTICNVMALGNMERINSIIFTIQEVYMKKILFSLVALLITAGCAASVSSQYGVVKKTDQFHNNRVSVTMKGGVIDADYLGIVSNPAVFNPYVVRSQDGKILSMGIKFTYEKTSFAGTSEKWLNIGEGSTIIYLINKGADKVVIHAVKGGIDYDVSAPMGTVYTTKYDAGVFSITPEQMKKIADANTVEVRVTGTSGSKDFPRKPNNHLIKNFIPNYKMFYETEILPYVK
ncbi:MAG TPA: hypothetical protein DCO77_10715 [Nitrospiraceae bacterium]|nr:hypothetical protein [Nitrospiraceae bacterium]